MVCETVLDNIENNNNSKKDERIADEDRIEETCLDKNGE